MAEKMMGMFTVRQMKAPILTMEIAILIGKGTQNLTGY
jgi:hypothetical protein